MSYRRLIGKTYAGLSWIFVGVWLAFFCPSSASAEPRALAPTQLEATPISSSEILLNWVDTNVSERGYEIEAGEIGRGFSEIGETEADGYRFIARNLRPNTTYNFRIKALAKRNSRYSNTVTASTFAAPASDVTPPSITILGPTLDDVSANSIQRSSAENSSFVVGGIVTLSADASDDTGVVRVDFYRDNNVLIASDSTEPYSATLDTTALPNGPHTIHAVAFDAAGNSSRSGTVTLTFDNPSPAAPEGLSATATSTSQISLSWRDQADNESGFKLERSTSSSFLSVTTINLADNTTSFVDSGLAASTLYYYRVKAVSANWGDSDYSAIVSAQTQENLTPPNAPSNLSVSSGGSSSSMSLAWKDNSDNETIFKIERGPAFSGPWTQVATVVAGTTSYRDNGLSSASFYVYRVRASNTIADSSYSNMSGDSTRAGSTPTLPAAPGSLTAVAISASQINLSWIDHATDETGFKVERSVSASGPWTQVDSLGANVTAYSDSTLSGGTLAYYRVRATNGVGDSDYSNLANATTQINVAVPSAPSSLSVNSGGASDSMNLTWKDNSGDETEFKIERAFSFGGPWTQVGSVPAGATSYKDVGLKASWFYAYRVRASNAAGNSPYSNNSGDTTRAGTTVTVPSAPASLVASAGSASQISLAWADNSNDESGFKIERAPTLGGPWSQIGTAGAGATSFVSSGLTPSTLYCYRVRAYNSAGDSDYSNAASATTIASNPSPSLPSAPGNLTATAVSTSQINLSWSDASSDETGFKIERASAAAGPWTQVGTSGVNATSYSDSGLAAGTLYYYRVRASNAAGDSGYSNSAGTSTQAPPSPSVPAAPSGLVASAASTSQINLTWIDNSTDEAGFKIERALSPNGPWTQIGTTTAGVASFANTGLAEASTYYFRVRAQNGTGDSAYSSVALATTLSGSAGSLTIPQAHPRLWWNAERLSRARAWYASNPFTPSSGDPLNCALRYVLTGESSYARTAINWLLSYEIPAAQLNPSDPWVSSDQARWNGENAILVFDWCFDQMADSERETVINRWNYYIETLRQKRWGGTGMEANNYYWGYLRNELEWGIASYHENSSAQTFVNHALVTRWQNSFLPYAANAGKGGALAEGPGYGIVNPWYSLVPFITVGNHGRDLYEETDFFKEAIFFILYSTTPAPTSVRNSTDSSYQVFHFNDEEYPEGLYFFTSRKYYGDVMNVAANKWAGTPLGQYARRWVNMVRPAMSKHVAAVDAGGVERDFGSLPLDYYSRGLGYLYSRNNWGSQATLLNVQLGEAVGVGHSHWDFGTWQMWRKGRWVCRETTGYSNNIAGYAGSGSVDVSDTLAHNGLLLGGRGIPRGHRDGKPQVLRVESRPEYSFAAVDLTRAYQTFNSGYPADLLGNQFANRVIREFIFLREWETLVIFDRIESRAYGSTSADSVVKTFLAHFEYQPQVQGGGKVLGVNGDQALRLITLVPANPSYRVVNEGSGTVSQYRVEIEISGSAQSYFLHVAQARDANGSDVSAQVSDSGSGYTVSLQHPIHGNTTIVLSKGMTSSGGSVNGQPLTTQIQNVSVTVDGPVWE